MEDEISLGNVAHGPGNIESKSSPESPCVKGKGGSSNNSNNNYNNHKNHSNNNKEQDRFLPIANVGRIMKKVIPSNGKISKDAKETVQECVSEFISFVTGEASDKCQREKRKTINGDDIIWAITTLGFEEYVKPLKLYLSKYRDIEGEKVNIPKQQIRSDHQKQQQQQPFQLQSEPEQIISYNTNTSTVYSSTNLLPHHNPSFLPSDQPFPLPNFSRKQSQQQDQIDSVEHW